MTDLLTRLEGGERWPGDNAEVLRALLARVKDQQPRGDRTLTREIMCTVGGWHRITPSQGGGKHGGYISPEDWTGRHADGSPILDSLHGTSIWRDVPDIRGSVDAALEFARRLMPGHTVVSYGSKALLLPSDEAEDVCFLHAQSANSPALAIVAAALAAAILRAKEAEHG